MRVTWLADELRAAGLTVIEIPGWKTRGANTDSDGRVFAPRGVVEHHTAGPRGQSDASAARVIVTGNATVPGPLSQLMVGRELDARGLAVMYVIAAGKANHCGAGAWRPDGHGPLEYSVDAIGIEIHNDGIGERYAQGVARTVLIATAAILRRLGRPAALACSHHEWVQGSSDPRRRRAKVDPRGPVELYPWGGDGSTPWDMGLFRSDLADLMRPTIEEDDMPLNADDLKAVELHAQLGLAKALGATDIASIPDRIEELVDAGVRRTIRDERSGLHRGLAAIKGHWTDVLKRAWPPKNPAGKSYIGD